jgi:STE24 endopeptidase
MNEDRGARFQRLRRRASLVSLLCAAATLGGLFGTGLGALLRDGVVTLAGESWFIAALLYSTVLTVCTGAIALPRSVYINVLLERRYGLTSQTVAQWVSRHARDWLLRFVAATTVGLLTLICLRWLPAWWWLAVGGICVLVLWFGAEVATATLDAATCAAEAPRLDALGRRLVDLAARADARVLGVVTRPGGTENGGTVATLAGFGHRRRIVLTDTLVSEHTDDEVEVILAHELSHHVHHDLLVSGVWRIAMLCCALYAADRVLVGMGRSLGVAGKDDLLALPLVILVTGTVCAILSPIGHALSRAQERRADRFAVSLTGNALALERAIRRLAARHLADEYPTTLVRYLFYSHPPVAERIAAARARHRS